MSTTYLLIDFFTILIPFVFSFHPKLNFYRTWRAFFPAVIITAIYFIAWDAYFTSWGVWGFNPQYLTGIGIGNLPLEELLFFFCIPYACVFTYHCLQNYIGNNSPGRLEHIITLTLVVFLTVTAVMYHDRLYTFVTFISLAVLLGLARYVLHVKWLAKFYLVYAILLVPFLIVNGLLTGTGLDEPVVWYNDEENTGLRILTIPVEDIFYGMELVLMNLLLYHYFLPKKKLARNGVLSRA